MSEEVAILERYLARERAARKQAEELLDSKTLDLHQVNQELSQATETLQSLVYSRTAIISNLIANLNSGILLENEQGEIMFANQVFCNLFQIPVPPSKLVDKKLARSFRDFQHVFKDPEKFFEKLPRVFEDNQKIINEEMELTSGITIESDFIPIDNMSGQKGRLWQFRDITEKKSYRKSIERSERRFKLIAEYHEQIRGTDLATLMETTIQFLKEQVGIEEVSMTLVDPKNENLSSWIHESAKETTGLVTILAKEHLDRNTRYRGEIDASNVEERDHELLKKGFRSDLKVPLILEGEYLGNLTVASRQVDGISEDTRAILSLLEPQLTYALKNLILIQDLEHSKDSIKQSEEKYRGIMENMELGLMEVDNDSTIVKVYDRFCKLTGYNAEELLGQNAQDVFLLPEYAHTLDAQELDRNEGKSGVYEIEIPTKTGERKWVLVSGSPFYDQEGQKLGSIGIHLDISERKQMEKNLILAKAEAEKAQEAEKIFLANMSHEIRNPLNAVIGMTHLLFDTSPTKEQLEYLNYINNSSEILLNLISDILDLSKIHANEISFNPTPISLRELLRDIQSLFEVRSLEKGIGFEFTFDNRIENQVIGDQLIIHQILNNLLGNALKFTDEGGVIRLKIELLEQTENQYDLQFLVEDTGIGIKQEHLSDIFAEFKQADSNTKIKYGGTGLGLTICKKLIKLHGGSISVKSIEHQGSTFIIQIPFERTATTDKGDMCKKEEKVEVLDVGKVLIVEDNLINRKYLSRTLQKWNITCDEAQNGLEALAKLETKSYDLLIMDIRMPEMDGYEAIANIRKHPNDDIRGITAIALTADAMREEREKAYHLGFNYHITKPFRSDELKKKLIEIIAMGENYSPKARKVDLELDSYFDQGVLNALYEGDLHYMTDMFKVFCTTTPKDLAELENAIEEEDWKGAKTILHRGKPTFEMVGKPYLTQKAGYLEAYYDKRGTLPKGELLTFISDIKDLISRVENEIKKIDIIS